MRILRLSLLLCSAFAGSLALWPPHLARADYVTLEWTAPADDSLSGGFATAYDIRVSTAPIDEDNFRLATAVTNVPKPSYPGSLQRATVDNVPPAGTLYFALKTADERGNWSPISNLLVVAPPLAVEGTPRLDLSLPTPNPAHGVTEMTLTLTRAGEVEVAILDAAGREVRELVKGMRAEGPNRLRWDLRDGRGHLLGAGIYWVRARAEGRTFTRRMILLR